MCRNCDLKEEALTRHSATPQMSTTRICPTCSKRWQQSSNLKQAGSNCPSCRKKAEKRLKIARIREQIGSLQSSFDHVKELLKEVEEEVDE